MALPDHTLPHHMECFEAAETVEEMKVAVEQFKRFLAFKKLPSKTAAMARYLPPEILAKAKALNFGEERQIDVDGILDLVKIILAEKAPHDPKDPTGHLMRMRRRAQAMAEIRAQQQDFQDIEDWGLAKDKLREAQRKLNPEQVEEADTHIANLQKRLADLEENLAKP